MPTATDSHKKVVGLNPNPGNFLLVEFACSPCVHVASLQELLSDVNKFPTWLKRVLHWIEKNTQEAM